MMNDLNVMNNPWMQGGPGFHFDQLPADMISLLITFYSVIVILVIWSVIWKGIGLWRAARMQSKHWFIAILVFNTAGILPILYILFTRKKYAELTKAQPKKQS